MKFLLRRSVLAFLSILPLAAVGKVKSSPQAPQQKGVDLQVVFRRRASNLTAADDARLKSLAASGGGFHIVGRGDPSYVPGLAQARAAVIRERLIVHGADPDQITCIEGEPREVAGSTVASDVFRLGHAVPVQEWRSSPSEFSLEQVLTRWAHSSGWRLDWQSGRQVPSSVVTPLRGGDFLHAASQALLAAKAAGHPLAPEAFANKVLVIR